MSPDSFSQQKNMHIDSLEVLRKLYGPAKERALRKQMAGLDVHCQRFIQLSPFVVLASSGQGLELDASPRGGVPGFVKVLDQHTLLIPDSPGNNRLDTLENILMTGKLGLLFLIPGVDETLRVNGAAELYTDQAYLDLCQSELKGPKLVIKVAIKEVYLHCAKAFMRSRLWAQSAQIERKVLPTMNDMIGDQTGLRGETQEETMKRYLNEL